jgi:hypothetical protein
MEPSPHHRSCFVVAPTGAPVGPFLELLRSRRFEPFFISDFLTSRNKEAPKVRTAFRSVDFVIGLLFSGRPLESAFFELGIALGLAKPTIIFADLNTTIGDVFGGIEIRRMNLSQFSELIPAIEQFLRPEPASLAFKPAYVRDASTFRLRTRRPPHEQLKAAIKALRDTEKSAGIISAGQLEAEIARAFASSAGVTAIRAPRLDTISYRPDLALWIDSVQKEIGNPIAVEIKTALDERSLAGVSSEVSAGLDSVGATAGIIVHTGPSLNRPNHIVQVSPLILIFSVDELTQLLEEGTFAAVLKDSQSVAIGRMS